MKSLRLTSALLALSLGLLVAAPAFADQGSDIERAQGYFDAGAQFYFEGEYGRAIVEFRKAHQAHPHPIFLYNIALSSTQLGRFDQAYDAAIQVEAMEETLPPEQQARNRGIIRGVEASRAARKASSDISRAVAQRLEAEPPAIAADSDPLQKDSGLSTLGWAGVASLAIGALNLGGAALFDRQVQNGYEELQALSTGPSEEEFLTHYDHLQAQQSTGRILLYSGIGFAAVGAGLLTFDLLSSDRGDQNLAMGISSAGRSVTLRMRW